MCHYTSSSALHSNVTFDVSLKFKVFLMFMKVLIIRVSYRFMINLPTQALLL